MKLTLDLNSATDYRKFLQIKALPIYRFTGREAWFPDEYCSRLGIAPTVPEVHDYRPHPQLFDYQRYCSRIAIERMKFALFLEPGLGKTLCAFEFARNALDRLPKNRCVLLVSPSMVIDQTIGEALRFYGGSLPIERVRTANLQTWLTSGSSRFGIANYEAISDKIANPGRLGCLILDESSLLKSSYGKWGTRLIELGRGLDWKLCLTGTPAPNDRIEYANHAVFLDQFPTVNSFLAKFFVNRGETQNRWEMKPHALKPFYRALSHWCMFLSRPGVYGWKDNAAPLPPINVNIIDVPMTDAQWSAATTVSGNLFGIPGGIGSRAKIGKIAKGQLGNRPEFVTDLIRSEKTPCIVWCRYNPEQDDLARRIPDAANIDGRTPEDARVELIKDFLIWENQTTGQRVDL